MTQIMAHKKEIGVTYGQLQDREFVLEANRQRLPISKTAGEMLIEQINEDHEIHDRAGEVTDFYH